MLLCTFDAYSRRHLNFSVSDQRGAPSAYDSLIRAALKSGVARAVYFITSGVPQSRNRQFPAFRDAIEELQREFGKTAVQFGSVFNISHLCTQEPSLLLGDVPTFPRLCRVRDTFESTLSVPICAVLHSTNWNDLLGLYTDIIISGKSGDTLIATSTAGKQVISNLISLASEYIRTSLRGDLPKHLNNRVNIVTIPLGVDYEVFASNNRTYSRQILSLPLEATILLFCGRLTERSKADLEPLIVTFRRLLIEHSDLMLLLAGHEGPEQYAGVIAEMCRDLGVYDKVRVITNFPYYLKPLIYAASDILVSPVDHIQETFGLTLVEAMASGLPIVASNWSGYRDIVADGETGLLVNTVWNSDAAAVLTKLGPVPYMEELYYMLAQRTIVDAGDLYRKLQFVIQNPAMRVKLGTAAQLKAEREYAWPVVIDRFSRLWIEQSERATRDSIRRQPVPTVDYDGIYRHFGSSQLTADLRINCRPEEREWIEMRLQRAPTLPVSLSVITEVLDLVYGNGPTFPSIEDVVAENPLRIGAINLLVKKGYFWLT